MNPFETVIDQFGFKSVLVVGDIMLDRFIYGTVSRISPEAPTPVINTTPPEEVVGGAGNVARNIASLGARCDIVTVVGCDEGADRIRKGLEAYPGISPELVEVKVSCTRFRRHRVRCFMEQEVCHGETSVYARVQA
jgi:D-beta-D-heptose 7-phosphate kinase/D-beta-D-heptose 1-phosphate adenosyltransferase